MVAVASVYLNDPARTFHAWFVVSSTANTATVENQWFMKSRDGAGRARTEQRRKVTHDEKGGSGATTEMPPNKDILYDGYELN